MSSNYVSISKSLFGKVQKELNALFISAFPKLFAELSNNPVEVTRATQESFGDYQCSSAMKLAKPLKSNPRSIAEKVVAQFFETKDSAIKSLEIAGAGFINIRLKTTALQDELSTFFSSNFDMQIERPKRIVVDFSSPNVAKEMHVGHLRSTIIGDCLSRIFEFLGHDVLRLNHIGDWGTAFGMLIAYLKKEEITPKKLTTFSLAELMQAYRSSKKLFDESLEFKKRSQLEVVSLQSGEENARAIWTVICDISRKAYQEIYTLLNIQLHERGESFYNPLLPWVVEDLEKKGLVSLSEGAKCVYVDGFTSREGTTLPLMIQKSDGGYNYDTTDMAAVYQRIVEEKADRIIYVTDLGQATHFQMTFKVAQMAGYLKDKEVELNHVGFGVVLGTDGKKFRTRSGETEKLIDLLEEAITRASEIFKERHPEWSEEKRHVSAKILGLGAVKYADLSNNRVSDYVFSYDKMLKFEGNTCAFIMYAFVRATSILKRIHMQANASIQLDHPQEIRLALKLCQFKEVLAQLVKDLMPNRLTDYLFELAETFNSFFRDCRVEGSAEEQSRAQLCLLTQKVLKTGLELIGVETIDQM